MSLLTVTDLSVRYGGIKALKGISFTLEEGEIVTLIGANGAGKSTALKTISGVVKPFAGEIFHENEKITALDPQKIVSRGIVLVPEGRKVFPNLTVLENLRIGAYLRKDKSGVDNDLQHVYELFPRLKERHWQPAGTLSGGEQQMLAVGRGLMARPKILMMDEPSLGLAPMIAKDIFDTIVRINQEGVTILLIEQNANAALKIADRGYVLVTGSVRMEGTGKDLRDDEKVRAAYLGTAES